MQAAKAGAMRAIGIARAGDAGLLRMAGDLVVTTLDDVDLGALADGRVTHAARATATPRGPAHDRVAAAMEPTSNHRWVLRQSGYSFLFDTPNIEPPVPGAGARAGLAAGSVCSSMAKSLLMRSGDMLEHHRILDMRRGLLLTEWRQRDPAGPASRVRSLRLVSLAERALGLQVVRWRSIRPAEPHLRGADGGGRLGLEIVCKRADLTVWRTSGTGKGLAVASTAECSWTAGRCAEWDRAATRRWVRGRSRAGTSRASFWRLAPSHGRDRSDGAISTAARTRSIARSGRLARRARGA